MSNALLVPLVCALAGLTVYFLVNTKPEDRADKLVEVAKWFFIVGLLVYLQKMS